MGMGRDAAWNLAAAVALAAGQWAALAAVARLSGLAELGSLAWAMAVVLPLHLAAGMQQRTAIIAGGPGTPGQHLRLRAVTGAAAALLAVAIGWLHGPEAAVVAGLLGAARAIEGLGEVALGFRARDHGFAAVAAAQAGRALALAAGATAGAMGGACGAAAGMAIGSAAALLLCELPLLRRAEAAAAAEPLASSALFRHLAPLGAALALAALAGSLPRLVLEDLAGPAALGAFAAAATLAAAVATLGQAWLPGAARRLGRLHAAGDVVAMRSLACRLGAALGAAALAAAALAWPFGGAVLVAIFGPGLAGAGPLLCLLLVATAVDLAAGPAGALLTAAGAWRQQAAPLAAAAAAAAGAAVLLVPAWQAAGAALALLAAHALRLGWFAALVRGVRA